MGHLLLLKRKSNLPKTITLAIVLWILPGLGEGYRVAGLEARAPIYVSFFTHMQRSPIRGVPGTEGYMAQGPAPYSLSAKRLVDLWEKYGVKGEYGTTGLCLQQLMLDFPETVKKIKQLKLPVLRYPGAGHEQRCPIGRMRFTTELPLEEPTETVTVAAGTPLLSTETSALGQIISSQQVLDLPRNTLFGTPQFGLITAARAARVIQFALKFYCREESSL